MDLGQPPVLPVLRLPEPPLLPRPVLEVPRATLPSYKPLVVPPSDLRPPPGVRGVNSEEKKEEKPKPPTPPPPKPPPVPAQVRYVDIPGTDIKEFNGTIRRLTYWPTRLSNDTLQTITT